MVAINTLESTAYYQKSQGVDNYLDKFLELVSEVGYTDPRMVVVKFQKGLDPQIQNSIITMPYGGPLDTSPGDWYKAVKNIDQNQKVNEAFQSASCSALHPAAHTIPKNVLKTLLYLSSTPVKTNDGLKRDPLLLTCYRCHKTGHKCPDKHDIRTLSVEELEMEIMVRKDMARMTEPTPEMEKDFVHDNE